MGSRLGMAAMPPSLHRGRVLVCRGRALVDLLPSAQRAAYSKVPRRLRSLSVPSRSSSRRSISRNYHSSSGSINRNSCSTGPAAASQHGASGTVKVARARGRLALGGAALLVAGAALAREGQLPESVSEWDDKLVWEEVHELAQLSNMTNKDPPLIAKWFDCHGYTGTLVVRDLPEVANRYFVHVGHLPGEEYRRVHHIAIRGTVSLADLSIDLKTRQVFDEECGCMFHAGFKEVADAVADDVVQFLEDGAEIKIAGHSLGGAVAVIVAAKLRLRGYDVGKVMTFGAPMITDAAGAALLRDFLLVMRVTHERDPVPLTPLGRAKVSPTGDRVQESEAEAKAEAEAETNASRTQVWVDSAATGGGREEAKVTTMDLSDSLE
ncbi:unnamed protein product, partial [Laminaria digitata]